MSGFPTVPESTSHASGVFARNINLDGAGRQVPVPPVFLDIFEGGGAPLVLMLQSIEGLLRPHLQRSLANQDVHRRAIMQIYRRLHGTSPRWAGE